MERRKMTPGPKKREDIWWFCAREVKIKSGLTRTHAHAVRIEPRQCVTGAGERGESSFCFCNIDLDPKLFLVWLKWKGQETLFRAPPRSAAGTRDVPPP